MNARRTCDALPHTGAAATARLKRTTRRWFWPRIAFLSSACCLLTSLGLASASDASKASGYSAIPAPLVSDSLIQQSGKLHGPAGVQVQFGNSIALLADGDTALI